MDSLNTMGSVWVLEGGYNAFVLGQSIEASLLGLLGNSTPAFDDQIEREIHAPIIDANKEIIEEIKMEGAYLIIDSSVASSYGDMFEKYVFDKQ